MRSACSDIADYQWLTGVEAAGFLQDLAACKKPLHIALARLRRQLSPERTHLLVEQIDLRRRAATKFSTADRMFFTRTALEQATDEHVARYKAERFTRERVRARAGYPLGDAAGGRPPAIAELCCGIGGDLLALAEQGTVTAVDRSPIATHLAAANLLAVNPQANVVLHTTNVTQNALDGASAWHIDPDRRSTGQRTTSLDLCQPALGTIERLLAIVPHAAIKLAPASKVPAAWRERCELEWISRGGECRQLVAWHGELAQAPAQHRATILPAARGFAPRTITGTPDHPLAIASQVDQFIFDIDPAVLAAHLKATLAAEHNLSGLSHGPTYLTGPAPISDPALTSFQVDGVHPFRTKSLVSHLRDHRVGQLEIKKRGVDITPEKLRRELKLRGDNASTLLITPIAGRTTAILAHRVP
jgi:hypothetical protein